MGEWVMKKSPGDEGVGSPWGHRRVKGVTFCKATEALEYPWGAVSGADSSVVQWRMVGERKAL